MLSTPPAFILSQDQTLLLIVCPVKINSSCLIFPVLLGFVLNSSRTQGRFSFAFVLWIFRVCVLFNLQFSRFCAVVFLGDSLFIISCCFRFVNNFFQVFFKLFCFSTLFKLADRFISGARIIIPPLSTKVNRICIIFLNNFSFHYISPIFLVFTIFCGCLFASAFFFLSILY